MEWRTRKLAKRLCKTKAKVMIGSYSQIAFRAGSVTTVTVIIKTGYLNSLFVNCEDLSILCKDFGWIEQALKYKVFF